jgi:hypothetical protein
MKFGAKKNPTVLAGGHVSCQISFKISIRVEKKIVGISQYAYFSSGLRGHKRTYLTISESADHALFKMVRYVLLQPLRPELDAKTKTCLPAKTRFCHLDEEANSIQECPALIRNILSYLTNLNGPLGSS